jgi:hypothetical protein
MLVACRHVLACVSFLLLGGCGSDDSPEAAPPPSEPAPIQLILVGGQSNAGLGGVYPTLESRPLYPNVQQFAGAAKAGLGWAAQSEQDFTALETAYDDLEGGGQYVATMAGLAMGAGGAEYLVRTDWYGGRAIEFFVEGTINFQNTLHAARAAKRLAGARRVVCPWYVWIQGESGPADRAIYAEELRAYIASLSP